MAEAAASPSPAGEAAGQPVEEQTKAAGGDDSGGVDDGPPGEVAPAKPRQRKEKLPGVVSRGDGEDIFPDLGYKSRTGKRVGRAEAQKEADQEYRSESRLEHPEPPKEQAAEEPVAPKKFKFAGQEYDTAEAAEQSFKSLQGMFKPLNERVAKAEALAREAAEDARHWRQKAQSPTPPVAAPPLPSQSQPTDGKAAENQLQAALANVDGDMFETLARERGLPLAGRYLAAQVLASVHDTMLPALREEIMKEINPRLDPVTQSVEFQQQTQTVSTLIDNVAQLKNMDGAVAFPELTDENEMHEIAELWSGMDSPQPTPQSLIQAIALYRLYRGARSGSPTTQPQVNVPPPPTVLERPQPLEAGGAGARPTDTRAGQGNAQSRFARELDNVDLVDRTLGFAVRRRQ